MEQERIVKRAGQKDRVQQMVMTGGGAERASAADLFEPEEVFGLLMDDEEALPAAQAQALAARMKHRALHSQPLAAWGGAGRGGEAAPGLGSPGPQSAAQGRLSSPPGGGARPAGGAAGAARPLTMTMDDENESVGKAPAADVEAADGDDY